MNKCIFLFLACTMILTLASAQQLTWLAGQPNMQKDAVFYIAQWNDDELVVNVDKWLMIFDKGTLQTKKSISKEDFSEKNMGMGLFETENGWFTLGSSCKKWKKNYDCYLQYLQLEGNGFGTAKNWIKFPEREKGMTVYAWDFYSVKVSENKKYLLHQLGGQFSVYDASFTKIYEKNEPDIFKENGRELKRKELKRYVDNDGNMYLTCILVDEQKRDSDAERYKILFMKYDKQSDQFFHHIITPKDGMLLYPKGNESYVLAKSEKNEKYLSSMDELKFTFDTKKQRIIVAGTYGDEDGGGVFCVQYDCKSNQIVPLQKHPFPSDLSQKIAEGNFEGKKIKGKVVVQDLLLKQNGDAMLLLELDNSDVGVLTNENKLSRPDIEVLDVIYFNFGVVNELKFYGNISKRQEGSAILEELYKAMEEFFLEELSFVAVCVDNDVHVFYNILSKKEGRELVDIKIDVQGKTTRTPVIRRSDDIAIFPNKLGSTLTSEMSSVRFHKNSFLGNTMPMQVSENEVVVRAMKDKKNTLLKISY